MYDAINVLYPCLWYMSVMYAHVSWFAVLLRKINPWLLLRICGFFMSWSWSNWQQFCCEQCHILLGESRELWWLWLGMEDFILLRIDENSAGKMFILMGSSENSVGSSYTAGEIRSLGCMPIYWWIIRSCRLVSCQASKQLAGKISGFKITRMGIWRNWRISTGV